MTKTKWFDDLELLSRRFAPGRGEQIIFAYADRQPIHGVAATAPNTDSARKGQSGQTTAKLLSDIKQNYITTKNRSKKPQKLYRKAVYYSCIFKEEVHSRCVLCFVPLVSVTLPWWLAGPAHRHTFSMTSSGTSVAPAAGPKSPPSWVSRAWRQPALVGGAVDGA